MIHNDHLATPQKMTDSSGTVVWAADYKPFGETTVTVSTITNNLRFPGQYFDVEAGLNYNYFRDYNPVIGRYVQADPLGILGGENHLYVYAYNNSLGFYDPEGLIAWVALLPCIRGAVVSAALDVGLQRLKCQMNKRKMPCNDIKCPPIDICSAALSAAIGCAAGYISGHPPATWQGFKFLLIKTFGKGIAKYLAKLSC